MTRMRRKATVHLVEVDPAPRIRGIVRHGAGWSHASPPSSASPSSRQGAGRGVPSCRILNVAPMDQWTKIWQAEATARRRLIGAPFSVWRLAALPRSEDWPETLDRLGRRP